MYKLENILCIITKLLYAEVSVTHFTKLLTTSRSYIGIIKNMYLYSNTNPPVAMFYISYNIKEYDIFGINNMKILFTDDK